jgi:hypothetical protein
VTPERRIAAIETAVASMSTSMMLPSSRRKIFGLAREISYVYFGSSSELRRRQEGHRRSLGPYLVRTIDLSSC